MHDFRFTPRMSGWDVLWEWLESSPLGATVAGGLIVALIIALFGLVFSALRKRSWNAVATTVARFFKWLSTMRLTATRWIADGDGDLREEKIGVGANDRHLAVEINDDPRRHISADQLQSKPKLPAPDPRWRIVDNGSGEFRLANSVDRSVALEVRLEAGASYFDFLDGAHWEDVSGKKMVDFRGRVTDWARTQGSVLFDIHWRNENADARVTTFRLPAGGGAHPVH